MLALPAALDAQDLRTCGDITGRVLDDSTGEPISGAVLRVLDHTQNTLRSAVTDDAGGFRLSGLRRGPFRLRVARIGFAETLTPTWYLRGCEILVVEVRLHPEAVVLAPLSIVASRRIQGSPVLEGFHERRTSGLGTYITRSDIEHRRPQMVTDLLASVPGVQLIGSGTGARRTVHFGRAAANRDCPAQVYLDGMLLNRPIRGGDPGIGIDDAVHPGNVEGIEIYRGLSGVPAEFLGPQAHCGVVVIWTRRQVAAGG
jgi:hypothetical protein